MTHKLLRILNKAINGIFEHKFCIKLGVEYGNFPELEQLIADGFAKRMTKDEGFIIQGIFITDAGKAELARLDSIPPVQPKPTAEQLRMIELKSKLKDNTITFEETKELLRLFFRV